MDIPCSLSPAGLALLKAYEQLRLDTYLDEGGRLTIYWGHLIRAGEQFDHTPEQADAVLSQDLYAPAQCIAAWTSKVHLAPHQTDALILFGFNVGCSALCGSTLLRLIQAGDLAAAADEFPKWDKVHDKRSGRILESAGLRKRREAERALFLGLPWSPP